MILIALWAPWRAVERRMFPIPNQDEEVFVVLGFPRSGTSLIAKLLAASGISFGDVSQFRPADWRNPEGFFEYASMNRIDMALMRQGDNISQHSFSSDGRIRAKRFLARIQRIFTRLMMLRVLNNIRSHSTRWAFKEFPAPFYFWAPYVSKAKIVAVYRDPIETSYSESKSFGRMSFVQYLDEWTRAHEELLYHLGTRKSVLISLSDLSAPESCSRVVTALATFIGGDVKHLEKGISGGDRFNKTKDAVQRLVQMYPLPLRTKEVLAALERIKI